MFFAHLIRSKMAWATSRRGPKTEDSFRGSGKSGVPKTRFLKPFFLNKKRVFLTTSRDRSFCYFSDFECFFRDFILLLMALFYSVFRTFGQFFAFFFRIWSAPVEHFFADFSSNFRLFSSTEISFKIVFLRLLEKNPHSGDALGDHFSIDFESFFNAF